MCVLPARVVLVACSVQIEFGRYFLIVSLSGPPSAPGLTLVPDGDLTSFSFTITPSIPLDCVVNYIITATSSDGSRNINVDGSTPVNVDGFDVCATTYIFTVVPETSGGTGPRSASVR